MTLTPLTKQANGCAGPVTLQALTSVGFATFVPGAMRDKQAK
jgi:hypothetical protein